MNANLEVVDIYLAITRACQARNAEDLTALLAHKPDLNSPEPWPNTLPLHLAAVLQWKQGVDLLLSAGADINSHDASGQTALYQVVDMEYVDMAAHLLSQGACVQGTSTGRNNFLHAARRGNLEIFDLFAKHGAMPDEDKPNPRQPSALMEAADAGSLALVKRLIAMGARVDRKDEEGNTALMMAAGMGHHEVAQALIEAGANPNCTNKRGQSMIEICCDSAWTGTGNVCLILLRGGARVDQRNSERQTPIFHCAARGNTQAVAWCLDHGAIANAQDRHGTSVLQMAAASGVVACVELLLERGALVGLANEYGSTAMHCAAAGGHAGVVARLLENGARPDMVSRDGLTPIMQACSSEHTPAEVVRLLLGAGASPNRKSPLGTALHSAATSGNVDAARLLLSEGARYDIFSERGLLPIHAAVLSANPEVAVAIIEHGADAGAKTQQGEDIWDIGTPETLAHIRQSLAQMQAQNLDNATQQAACPATRRLL